MKLPRKSFEAEVPSMAMGDIAFLLLIFFVLLARAVDDRELSDRILAACREAVEQI